MANYLASDTDLTAVANAIRTKGGTSASLTFPQGFVDAVGAIQTGGGGGETIETAIDAIKAFLRSNGYVLSEFTVVSPSSGSYIAVPHLLGAVPNTIFAFNSELHIETTATGYQIGCATAPGQDNDNNRTYWVSASDDYLLSRILIGFPTRVGRSQYNFCQSASATEVYIRNGTDLNTKMLGTKWILAVK